MTFSQQYSWPVPLITAEALEKQSVGCGDVFYDHPDAYTAAWSIALNRLNYMLQIDALIEGTEQNQNTPLLRMSVFRPNHEKTGLIFEKNEELNYIELKRKLGWQA